MIDGAHVHALRHPAKGRRWAAHAALAAAAVAAGTAAAGGCQTPTSMTFTVSTDAPECDGSRDVLVALGAGAPDLEQPTATKRCARAGEVGTIVALPGADEAVEVRLQVALSITEATCTEEGPGCIVARRRLRFLPGEALRVDVPLARECAGVVCSPDQTCVADEGGARCTSATIDPAQCAGLDCREGDLGNDGTGDRGATSSATVTSASGTGGGGGGDDSSSSTGGGGGGGDSSSSSTGGGGDGGGVVCGQPKRLTLALSERGTCVVLDPDGQVACRGSGVADGISADGWRNIVLAGNNAPIQCVDALEAGGDQVCALVPEGASGTCPDPGVYCWGVLDGQGPAVHSAQRLPSGNVATVEHVAVTRATRCALGTSGGATVVECSADLPGMTELEVEGPLRGAAGSHADACAWSADTLRCAGGTGASPVWWVDGSCIVDADVGDTFRCWTEGDSVHCTSKTVDLSAGERLPAGATAIAAGSEHVCALGDDRAIRCWGNDDSGQLGGDPAQEGGLVVVALDAPTVAVASGANHSCALTLNGGEMRLHCWGDNGMQQICTDCAGRFPTPVPVPLPSPL